MLLRWFPKSKMYIFLRLWNQCTSLHQFMIFTDFFILNVFQQFLTIIIAPFIVWNILRESDPQTVHFFLLKLPRKGFCFWMLTVWNGRSMCVILLGGEEDVIGSTPTPTTTTTTPGSNNNGLLMPAVNSGSQEKPEGVLARTRKLSPFRTRSSPADSGPAKSSEEDLNAVPDGSGGSRHRRGGSLAPLR